MAQLSSKIKKYLDREVDFTKDIILQNDSDGQGDYIKSWNVAEAQPTDAQLNAFESQANDMETLNQIYANRQAEYPSVQDLVVALYDTDDKAAIDAKRAEIKLKYPKPGA
jgi:glutathionyl-hydroquinone reductase